MSDLQLALIALGAVLVAAVAGYNALQERRARRNAEAAFRGGHPDVLLGSTCAEPRRRDSSGAEPPPFPQRLRESRPAPDPSGEAALRALGASPL